MISKPKRTENSQSEHFKAAARELGCNEDEAAFEDSLKRVVQPVVHASDCALHNAPASEPERCDCGVADEAKAQR